MSKKMGFIRHSISYFAVILFLMVVNNITWGGYQWWLWPAIGWGIGVTAHFLTVFLPWMTTRFGKSGGASPEVEGEKEKMVGGLSPTDILGITLGSMAALVVIIGLIVGVQMRATGGPWNGWWSGAPWLNEIRTQVERGSSALRVENDQTVAGAFNSIDITTVAEIIVRGGSTDGVQVHSVKTAPNERAMAALEVNVETQGSRLVISEKRTGTIVRNTGAIAYTVTIPNGVTEITAHSVSGSITVEAVPPGISQNLTTVSGSIGTNRAADLHANTVSGGIRFMCDGDILEARSVSGSVEGTILAMGKDGTVNIGSVSGSVDLTAFAALDATLKLHSLSGHVSCGFPVTVTLQKNNSLEGRIGEGAIPITINTISGSIGIAKE